MSNELVLSPEFLALSEEVNECIIDDYFLLTETMVRRQLDDSLDQFAWDLDNFTQRLEELDEDLVTEAGQRLDAAIKELNAEHDAVELALRGVSRYSTLVQDSYFHSYAVAIAQERIDDALPTDWPFNCLVLDKDEVVDCLQADYISTEILGTVFWCED